MKQDKEIEELKNIMYDTVLGLCERKGIKYTSDFLDELKVYGVNELKKGLKRGW